MPTAIKRSITEDLAKKKVNQFLIIAIGERLHSGVPHEFTIGHTRYWQVPVMLGEKEVGNLEVDAHTGRLRIEEDTVSNIISVAKRLSRTEGDSSSGMYLEQNAS